ncbi:MAG: hypothetical protein ACYS5V_16380, partial [Planctomycetota bacterium]
CFPTVDACAYPAGDGFDVPDHGELCWLPWQVRAEADRLDCRARSALRWAFQIANHADRSVPCLHVMHALMPPQEIVHLRLPARDAIHDESREGIPPWAGGDDPAAYLLTARPRTAHMLLLRRCGAGRAEVGLGGGPTIEIVWPLELFPTLGIWWNNGGHPDEDACRRHECALEPMPGSTSSLASSHADGMHLTVPPRDSLSWSITWTVRTPGERRGAG